MTINTITAIIAISFRLNIVQSSNDICVSGHDNTVLDGTYTWLSFEPSNRSIYYCNDCEPPAYLYALRDTKTWRIGENCTSDTSFSYCPYTTENTINPIECTTWNTWDIDANKWNTPDLAMDLNWCQADHVTTTNIPTTTNIQSNTCIDGEWFDAINQRIINCNNVCVSGNDNEDLNGEYVWRKFDYQSNTSLYQCEQCARQPYLHSLVAYKYWANWMITDDYTTDWRWSYCEYSPDSSKIADVTDCITWYTSTENSIYNTREFHTDSDMFIEQCQYDVKTTSIFTTTTTAIIRQDTTKKDVGKELFDASKNINVESSTNANRFVELEYYFLAILMSSLFLFLGVIPLLDAKLCRQNDYFEIAFVFSAIVQIFDMVSDVLFSINVWIYFNNANNSTIYSGQNLESFIIFICSIVFIIVPIGISLFQLFRVTDRHWLQNAQTREWLITYSSVLYFTSIITGSAFNAVSLFNSNLFGLDIFYMGLTRVDLLSFTSKKVYSIILFENCPQLALTFIFQIMTGLNSIALISMIFSFISIVVTLIAMLLQNRICTTQDIVYITIDITGEQILDNFTIKRCTNRINNIKRYLCTYVLGVNEKTVEIMKPYVGSIQNGLQLQIRISYIHQENHQEINDIDVANNYNNLLRISVQNGTLQDIIHKEWKLSKTPQIGNVSCVFLASKQTKLEMFHAFLEKFHHHVSITGMSPRDVEGEDIVTEKITKPNLSIPNKNEKEHSISTFAMDSTELSKWISTLVNKKEKPSETLERDSVELKPFTLDL